MKTNLLLAGASALCLLFAAGCSKETKVAPAAAVEVDVEDTAPVQSSAQKTGYSLGVDNSQNLKNQFVGIGLDNKALARGFADLLNGRPLELAESEIRDQVAIMGRKMGAERGLQVDGVKAAYSVGVDHAANLREQFKGQDIDLRALAQGFSDDIHGRPRKVTDAEISAATQAMRRKMVDRMMEESVIAKAAENPLTAKNLAEGKKFLEENAAKPDVKTTESGLQYRVLKEGEGPTPTPGDKVTVHYTGFHLDGRIFDSSRTRKEPMTFGLGEVIKGWTEGLQLMKEGAKYKLFVPSEMAYGLAGMGKQIGPNAVLIFDVELLKVEKGAAESP